ncbi:MAG: hypothetical protein ACRC33_11470 [Gemmataceae bacterium]
MKSTPLTLWMPFGFALMLSAIVMGTFFATGSYEAGFPAFFCFLPLVTFFGIGSHARSQRQIQDLEARIERLEGRGPKGEPAVASFTASR